MKNIDIPEYYRQFQTKRSEKPPENRKTEKQPTSVSIKTRQQPKQNEIQSPQVQSENASDKTLQFKGDGFTFMKLSDWNNDTIYTFTGPVTDGIQHNFLITIDKENPFGSLEEYAEWHIKTLESDLKGCTLLKKGETKLTDGTDAYEAIFSWFPKDDLRIYQHQIFVQAEKSVYKLTASFTKKTRQTIGPQILRMMLSLKFQECPE